jgi:hypothetical protein
MVIDQQIYIGTFKHIANRLNWKLYLEEEDMLNYKNLTKHLSDNILKEELLSIYCIKPNFYGIFVQKMLSPSHIPWLSF